MILEENLELVKKDDIKIEELPMPGYFESMSTDDLEMIGNATDGPTHPFYIRR